METAGVASSDSDHGPLHGEGNRLGEEPFVAPDRNIRIVGSEEEIAPGVDLDLAEERARTTELDVHGDAVFLGISAGDLGDGGLDPGGAVKHQRRPGSVPGRVVSQLPESNREQRDQHNRPNHDHHHRRKPAAAGRCTTGVRGADAH